MKNLKTRKRIKIGLVFLLIFILLSTTYFGGIYFVKTHFLFNTKIEGVDCSFLNIEKAIEKIIQEKGEQKVAFHFLNGKTYEIALKDLDMKIDKEEVSNIFEKQHLSFDSSRIYELNGFISVKEEKLKEFLGTLAELQEENMIEPQNAYISWNETEFYIQKEVEGNVINFEEALKFALNQIKNDKKQIDFSEITKRFPETMEKDLLPEKDELNAILKSSINFELTDGNIVTLDSNIIKNWIYQDETGKYKFDVENGVVEFVENLAIKVDEASSIMKFKATKCEELATVNVPSEVRARLDKERQIEEIKKLLGKPEPITLTPIYDRELILENLISYVELDIIRQHIWVYIDGKLYMDSPCVTGNVRDGNGTPTGVFFLLNKNRKVKLEGFNNDGSRYSAPVEYWMRFYNGIGFHDATWRTTFGGDIYLTNGSHGCVNMPFEKAAQLYEVIDETMPIIVYESNS